VTVAGRIATISGTMLVPGVSRNRRLYSRELIAKAAARMSERITDPKGLPIVMRTHHEAGDNSQLIVGRLTGVKVGEDGAARYTADLYDTAPGRDIAALVTGDKPALRSVSIHGYWLGPVKSVQHEGESVTTGDDLEIDALDFTATPGVLGATVDNASLLPTMAPAAESSSGRTPISESVDATVEAVVEDATGERYSAQQKRSALAKGQAMKNASGDPAYTIKSKADLRRAIKAVGRGGADHDKIRAHIIARAQALGLTAMIPDNWNKDGSMKENSTRFGELREYYPDGPSGGAGFCIDAFNGPMSITMRSCSIDPADLRTIAAAAMSAAVDALQALDPDMDADIDVAGAAAEDTDDDMDGTGESAPPFAGESLTAEHIAAIEAATAAGRLTAGQHITPAVVTEALALTQTAPPAPGEVTPTTQEEAAMGEPTTQETAASARSLTDEDLTALSAAIGAALKESLAPLHAALTENAAAPEKAKASESVTPAAAAKAERKAEKKALKESLAELKADFDTKLAEALAVQRAELREELLRENGLPPRRGYRVHENERNEPTADDLFANRAELLLGDFGRTPQPAQ